MSKAKKILIVALPLFAATTTAPAQAWAEDPILIAQDSARMAGGARYCKADEELVDEYIGRSEGKLRALAKDDYEKVVLQIEFKNLMTAASAKEPEGGCANFLPLFEKTVKSER